MIKEDFIELFVKVLLFIVKKDIVMRKLILFVERFFLIFCYFVIGKER